MFPNQYLTAIVCSAFNLVANTVVLDPAATLDSEVTNSVALETHPFFTLMKRLYFNTSTV